LVEFSWFGEYRDMAGDGFFYKRYYRRDYKAENRRAYVRHVYKDLLSESACEALKRDLNTILCDGEYRKEGGCSSRQEIVKALRRLALELEKDGYQLTESEILVPKAREI
jgi:hypothetical protein